MGNAEAVQDLLQRAQRLIADYNDAERRRRLGRARGKLQSQARVLLEEYQAIITVASHELQKCIQRIGYLGLV